MAFRVVLVGPTVSMVRPVTSSANQRPSGDVLDLESPLVSDVLLLSLSQDDLHERHFRHQRHYQRHSSSTANPVPPPPRMFALLIALGLLVTVSLMSERESLGYITRGSGSTVDSQLFGAVHLKASLSALHHSQDALPAESSGSESEQDDETLLPSNCSVRTVKISQADDSDGFYSRANRLFHPHNSSSPVFTGDHTQLCNESLRLEHWQYCLPMAGRKDEPFCSHGDRNDLLNVTKDEESVCFSSVLHMLLLDVYEVLRKSGAQPALLYGTMLGAVRNGSLIPYTEDVDIGYLDPDFAEYRMDQLREMLTGMGYHMFKYYIWRVCIAPNHPLANKLYTPEFSGIVTEYQVPYVDLYGMRPATIGRRWIIDEVRSGRLISEREFEPYAKVKINGREFDTLADPEYFLRKEYGSDYMVPMPRTRRR